MNKLPSILLLFFCLLLPSESRAKRDTEQNKWGNMNFDAIECFSFYEMSIQGIKNMRDSNQPQKRTVISNLKLKENTAFKLAIRTAKLANVSTNGLIARIKLVRKSHRDDISHNLSNIAILMNRYLDKCNQMIGR